MFRKDLENGLGTSWSHRRSWRKCLGRWKSGSPRESTEAERGHDKRKRRNKYKCDNTTKKKPQQTKKSHNKPKKTTTEMTAGLYFNANAATNTNATTQTQMPQHIKKATTH
ncbi:hypothetical protein NL108_013287 [Boleophthalmus pectinirostris]|nr:hypothetical protein NL108_013287 [Boleophthalmus pectinirostris]